MNILFVNYICMVPTIGGTERVAYTVAKALQQRGHQIYFLALSKDAFAMKVDVPEEQIFMPDLSDDNERVQYINQLCSNLSIQIIVNEIGDTDNFNIFSKKLINNVTIISCLHFDIYGPLKHYKEKVRSQSRWKQLVWDTLDLFGLNVAQITNYLNKKKRMRKMLLCSHSVVVPTATVKKQLQKFTGMSTNNVIHIDNPYPFNIEQRRKKNQNRENNILFVGRLSETKQVHVLIKAWSYLCAKFPEWNLIILGDGKLRQQLEQLSRALNCKRIVFEGNVRNVEDYYNTAKILALPSAHECTGGVVLEALAHYVHPVAFRYSSVHEFIKYPEIGTVVRRKTVKAFTSALKRAVENWDIDKQCAIDSYIQQFSIENITDLWEDLFADINT